MPQSFRSCVKPSASPACLSSNGSSKASEVEDEDSRTLEVLTEAGSPFSDAWIWGREGHTLKKCPLVEREMKEKEEFRESGRSRFE